MRRIWDAFLNRAPTFGMRPSDQGEQTVGVGAEMHRQPVVQKDRPFKHTATADKFIYEAELRTGLKTARGHQGKLTR
jgi:hypothetical protein